MLESNVVVLGAWLVQAAAAAAAAGIIQVVTHEGFSNSTIQMPRLFFTRLL